MKTPSNTSTERRQTNPARRLPRALRIAWLPAALAFSISACGKPTNPPTPTPAHASSNPESAPSDARPLSSENAPVTPNDAAQSPPPTIHTVLHRFEAGEKDEALRLLLQLTQEPDEATRTASLRISDLSEAEFRRLSEKELRRRSMSRDEIIQFQQELIDQHQSLRRFSRFVLETAGEHARAGDPDKQALTLVRALDQCAEANTGDDSQVIAFSNMIGEHIKQLTTARLVHLQQLHQPDE